MQAETKFKRIVQADIKQISARYGGRGWQFKTQQVSVRGIPDIFAVINGVAIALELKKSALDEATPLQIYNVNCIRKAGGFAEVVCPESWPDARVRLLERLGCVV